MSNFNTRALPPNNFNNCLNQYQQDVTDEVNNFTMPAINRFVRCVRNPNIRYEICESDFRQSLIKGAKRMNLRQENNQLNYCVRYSNGNGNY